MRQSSFPPFFSVSAAGRHVARWAAGAALGCGWAAVAVAATSVATIKASALTAGGGFTIDATVQAVRQATVAAQIGGNVLNLTVKAGDRVQAGQVLARIDERDASAALARSDAGVAQAQAEWRNAQLNLERTRDLREKGFISQAALDVAQTQLKAAEAGAQQAQSAHRQAALARGFAAVVAPFDGVVLETLLNTGDLAAPGRPVATLYAPGAMRAVAQVPASRAALARAAAARHVVLPDGRQVAALRSAELPGTDPVAQTIEWRLDLPADAAVRPGQNVSVVFEGAAKGHAEAQGAQAPATALGLPAAAVLRRGELEAVYVAQDGRFVLRAVRLGAARGATVEVLAGLKAGESVAADAVRAGLAGAVPAYAASAPAGAAAAP